MARIVLIHGEHRNEKVASYHAKQVAKILRGMGHDVILEKVPINQTNKYAVRRLSAEAAISKLAEIESSLGIARSYSLKHDSFAFNFHATDAADMGNAIEIKPGQFSVVEYSQGKPQGEIEFKMGNKCARIEVPGMHVLLPLPLVTKVASKIEAIAEKLKEKHTGVYPKPKVAFHDNLQLLYHMAIMDLNAAEQKKYLHPVISKKIAEKIDKIVRGE